MTARWNLFRGGRDVAAKQESIRRSGEQRYALAIIHREVEEAVRGAWNQRGRRAELAGLLRDQAGVNAQLVSSYREQLRNGQRSLLDVLGAQNTRFNSAILSQTAVYAALFAEYRLLAATGTLASVLGTAPVEQSEAYAREEFRVQSVETPDYRRTPSRQTSALPLDLLAPIRKE